MWNFYVMDPAERTVFGDVIAGIRSKSVRVIWCILVILESGGCSVIIRWTVDQEVVGSDQTDGRNKIVCHARLLSRFTSTIR